MNNFIDCVRIVNVAQPANFLPKMFSNVFNWTAFVFFFCLTGDE